MRAALRKYSEKMRAAGFDYGHPDESRWRHQTALGCSAWRGHALVEKLSSDQQEGLRKLQEYERRVAKINAKLQVEIFEPVEEQIEKEMYAPRFSSGRYRDE